jgi:CBS domain-containing protein
MFDFDVLALSEIDETRSNDVFALGAVHMGSTVAALPRGPALTLSPEVSLEAAARALRGSRRTAAVVVREQRPLGVVTDRQILAHLGLDADSRTPERNVSQIMTVGLEPLRPTDTVGETLRRMCAAGAWHLPVVCDRGLLLGAIDICDVTIWLRDRMTLLSVDAALGPDLAQIA